MTTIMKKWFASFPKNGCSSYAWLAATEGLLVHNFKVA
jgi:hypothetical protein